MPGKTKMTATRRRATPTDEVFGPMALYQRSLDQAEVWPSVDAEGMEPKPIADMAPSYALNALHKLSRWQEHLFAGSTAKQYEEARTRMFESALVDALIRQALGEFYAGTWLPPKQMLDEGIRPAHLDDVVAASRGGDARQRQPLIEAQRAAPGQRFDEELLEVSITGAVELEANARESIGARARILYRILAEGITFPTTEAP